jgi:hypothetical protein
VKINKKQKNNWQEEENKEERKNMEIENFED